ncbi:glycerol kinase [Nakamurella sp. YIM 132087]|uniref:ATP:glycerol 3-phosphotransferase n=1 Tax=Nakamurella alba TaxID=2665158 RepID=A0A7K1FGP7_9ACTN|nr:FGGY family carbohydrate kinase [Nakamurella alba]MTD13236.1 glycerol kinase [Nakamurella alba]
MPTADLVLAVDQGSSSTKALLVSAGGAVVASASVPLAARFPRPGWVEQSPVEILDSVRAAVAQVLAGLDPLRVVGVGLSTQRESLALWDRRTGEPVGPLVTWQDQRGTELCDRLTAAGYADAVRERSGLPLDPMFSATKAAWLLDTFDPDRTRSRAGELCLGTVDAWLLHRLTGRHLTEVGNASRTQLMNIGTRQWDQDLLDLFGVPAGALGEIAPSAGPFPSIRGLPPLAGGTPVAAVMGDSHAALFAHAGWRPGTVKATYGTGSSVMGLCPDGISPEAAGAGLCLTVAWDDGTGARYAAEGNIRSSGSTLTWLARTHGTTPADLADLARTTAADGVHIVPAFNGLGAPYWDREAVGIISGLTMGSGLPQLARAALESIAYQIEDVVAAFAGTVADVHTLHADGGASSNPDLMQLQADISGRLVQQAADTDLSPLGAAHLAGLRTGLWTQADIEAMPRDRTTFTPTSDAGQRERLLTGWRDAVARARLLPAPAVVR